MSSSSGTKDGVVSMSHVGLCVSDLERSLRFYTEGLGFERADGFDIDDGLAHLAEVPAPVECRAQFITHGSLTIELLGWRQPAAEGKAATSRRQLGFTHLSVNVDDLAAVEARLVGLGARTLEDTRTHMDLPGGRVDIVFLADPDGVRIELNQFRVDP
jgi:lactoylglutathione lyase